ncbi:MAG: PH domain-containing protein [Eggerthellaceae bacterium]|nr:PH domain-containing protein [Eggerthellaceae bacterium]
MRDFPTQALNPKIKSVWRLSDLVWILIVFFACAIPFALIATDDDSSWALGVLVIEVILFVILLVLFLVILPPIRYARFRYEVSDDFLEIAQGIIWRKRYMVPFIRVQNTDTRQGPILRAFGLASVTISTAAGSLAIPGLDAAEADTLRDRAAELARLAREDV